MAETSIGGSDSRTVTQYQQDKIAEQALKHDVFEIKGFVGDDANSPIMKVEDLAVGKGNKVEYYLEVKLSSSGVTGDNTLRGNEEPLTHQMDSCGINQIRNGIILEGRMSEQNTRIKLRKRAPKALGRWGGEWRTELCLTMLSGARGANSGKLPSTFTGFGGNTLVAPDSGHQLWGGSATAKANLAATDKYDLSLVDKFVTLAETIEPQICPISIDGEDKFMGLVHPYQYRDMKQNTATGQWLDLQKSVTQGGKQSQLFKNSGGEYAGVVFHKFQDIRTFTDYGAGANVAAARGLFLGAQAGVLCYGEGYEDGQWEYVEIKDDYNNKNGFGVGMIVGIKPCIFNSLRFGMAAADTAAAA